MISFSLEPANGPYDTRFFVQRWNDDADAHITLKANRLYFRNYHAQGAGASAVIAGSLGCVTFSSSRTLGRLSQRLRQNAQQGRSRKARTDVERGRCIRTFPEATEGHEARSWNERNTL